MARRNSWSIAASKQFVANDRCLFGADDTTRKFTAKPQGIEYQMGKRMGVRNRHYSWNASTSTIGKAWSGDASGSVPMVSLGGQGYTEALVKEIATGKHDDYWKSLFASLSKPGLFRPWMEMNGAHNAYQADVSAFKEMWAHVRSLYAAESDHLVWIFCPQQYDPHQIWVNYTVPGDQYEWFGLDLYRNTFAAAKPWADYARKNKKPFCIAESGFEQNAVVLDVDGTRYDKDGSKTGNSLILKTLEDVKAHPNCVMYLVWNNIGPAGDDFIDTSAKSLFQYRQFASDGYFMFGS